MFTFRFMDLMVNLIQAEFVLPKVLKCHKKFFYESQFKILNTDLKSGV